MTSNDCFTFLSWNLCLLENSRQAPANWQMDQAESKVRELVLKLNPDFVFFQELPGLVPYVETHDLVPANTVSHSGNIATLARTELMEGIECKTIGRFAVVSSLPAAGITFANVHLEPGRNGESKRLASFKRLISDCKTPGLIVVGDTNTRTEEEPLIGPHGLVGNRPPRPTWDSRKNRFRERGGKYTAFYTRYFHSENIDVTDVEVWDQPLYEDGKKFFLSDHFAMSGRVTLQKNPG